MGRADKGNACQQWNLYLSAELQGTWHIKNRKTKRSINID